MQAAITATDGQRADDSLLQAYGCWHCPLRHGMPKSGEPVALLEPERGLSDDGSDKQEWIPLDVPELERMQVHHRLWRPESGCCMHIPPTAGPH